LPGEGAFALDGVEDAVDVERPISGMFALLDCLGIQRISYWGK
jgi:hypothetical protein